MGPLITVQGTRSQLPSCYRQKNAPEIWMVCKDIDDELWMVCKDYIVANDKRHSFSTQSYSDSNRF